jgi:uncharacterized membrane protein YagU involved in acid resistance
MPNRPLISGAIFGVLVYLFMNFVVMPLSAVPFHINYTASKILVSAPLSTSLRLFLFKG